MSKRNFLVRLAVMAIVALSVSAAAPRQARAGHAYASNTTSSEKSSVKVNTTCGMSGYMVAVG